MILHPDGPITRRGADATRWRFIEVFWFRGAVSVSGGAAGAAHTNRYYESRWCALKAIVLGWGVRYLGSAIPCGPNGTKSDKIGGSGDHGSKFRVEVYAPGRQDWF